MKFKLANSPCKHKIWEWFNKYGIRCTQCDVGMDMISRDDVGRVLVFVEGPEPKYEPELLPVCRLIYGMKPEMHFHD